MKQKFILSPFFKEIKQQQQQQEQKAPTPRQTTTTTSRQTSTAANRHLPTNSLKKSLPYQDSNPRPPNFCLLNSSTSTPTPTSTTQPIKRKHHLTLNKTTHQTTNNFTLIFTHQATAQHQYINMSTNNWMRTANDKNRPPQQLLQIHPTNGICTMPH